MDIDIRTHERTLILVQRLIDVAERRDITIGQEEALDEIEDAILEYYNDRHYTPTQKEPFEKIYEGIIVKLALSSVLKKGAEGEKSHNEGGVSRVYDTSSEYPLAITQKIIPLAKGL